MEASAKEVNILIAILREGYSRQRLQTAFGKLQIKQQKLQDQKGMLSFDVSLINAFKGLKSRFQEKLFEVPNFFQPCQATRQQVFSITCTHAYSNHQEQLLLFCELHNVYIFMTLGMALRDTGPAAPILNAPISRLSADHFSIIVKFLEFEDIQSARLAGRELHFFLSPYLIKSIRFAAQGERLHVLERLSHNEVFSRSVRTLHFDMSLFELPHSIWNELDASG
jgi:hypothetical protein